MEEIARKIKQVSVKKLVQQNEHYTTHNHQSKTKSDHTLIRQKQCFQKSRNNMGLTQR